MKYYEPQQCEPLKLPHITQNSPWLETSTKNVSRIEDVLHDAFGWEKLTVDEEKCDIVTP